MERKEYTVCDVPLNLNLSEPHQNGLANGKLYYTAFSDKTLILNLKGLGDSTSTIPVYTVDLVFKEQSLND